MIPSAKYWRSNAISIVAYLDDGISAAQRFSKCEEHSLPVKSDLFKSRFVPNKDKCQWVPIQVICWLGIFGISRAIVCLYHWERFQGSLTKWLNYVLQESFCKETCSCYGENYF